MASSTWENSSELLTTVKKGYYEFVGKEDSIKRVEFFICTENTRICYSTCQALENTKGMAEDPPPNVPKVPPPMNRDTYR